MVVPLISDEPVFCTTVLDIYIAVYAILILLLWNMRPVSRSIIYTGIYQDIKFAIVEHWLHFLLYYVNLKKINITPLCGQGSNLSKEFWRGIYIGDLL